MVSQETCEEPPQCSGHTPTGHGREDDLLLVESNRVVQRRIWSAKRRVKSRLNAQDIPQPDMEGRTTCYLWRATGCRNFQGYWQKCDCGRRSDRVPDIQRRCGKGTRQRNHQAWNAFAGTVGNPPGGVAVPFSPMLMPTVILASFRHSTHGLDSNSFAASRDGAERPGRLYSFQLA